MRLSLPLAALVRTVRRAGLLLGFLALLGGALSSRAVAAEHVRVGVQDLPPLAFIDKENQAQGLFVELLEHIAVQEEWKLEFVPGSMRELQELTARGEIDLLPAFAYTVERTRQYDFPEQFVHLEWGVVILPAGSKLETLLDLQGLEIAVVRSSAFTAELRKHLEQYHVVARLIEHDNYQQVAAAVADGKYPAGISGNVPAQSLEAAYDIQRSPILFAPLHLTFATGNDHKPHLLKTINRHLVALKADPESVYYQLREQWLPHPHPHENRFVYWGGGLLAALLLLGWLAFSLRHQVKSKIAEVVEVNLELQQNREELRRLNQQFQTLLDGIPDHLLLISPTLQVIWMNRAARLHSDSGKESSAAMICFREWSQTLEPCNDCPVQACFASGQTQETVLPNGDKVFGVKAFPIFGAAGEVESVIKLAIDITDKVKRREENNRQNRLSAVGTLAAGVAHEINNPAGLILSNLEIINDTFVDTATLLDQHYETSGDFPCGGLPFSRMREQLPVLLKETGDAARRISQTVADLKDFARDGGTREVTDFPLKGAIERSVRLTDHVLRKATDHFTLDLATETVILRGNARRIEQVLVNLLANACQALPDRSRAITLTTRFQAETQTVLLTVRDQGAGIAAEDLPKLATPFFTTRQAEGGTGLGLSVSFGIVKEHGGTILFDSEVGKGTTVTLTLPASIQESTS